MPMTDDELERHFELAAEALRTRTEEERREMLERVQATLAIEGLELDSEEREVLLALARGDITREEAFRKFQLPLPRSR